MSGNAIIAVIVRIFIQFLPFTVIRISQKFWPLQITQFRAASSSFLIHPSSFLLFFISAIFRASCSPRKREHQAEIGAIANCAPPAAQFYERFVEGIDAHRIDR
jgi:hypothetical protein